MITIKKGNKEFNRFNTFQIGIIPLHITLLILFSKIYHDFVRIDIPIDLLRSTYIENIHIYIIAPSSFRNVVYLILYFLTFFMFLSFLDFVDFKLRQRIFGKKASPAILLSVFSVLCVVFILVCHSSYSSVTISFQHYLTLIREDYINGAANTQRFSDFLIGVFLILPFVLSLFPCEVIYKKMKAIILFFITLFCSNTRKSIPAEEMTKVYNSSGKIDAISFFLLFIDEISWKSGWLHFETLRILYFLLVCIRVVSIMPNGALGFLILLLTILIGIIMYYFIGASIYVNDVELFCEEISLDPKNRKAWIDEYNNKLEISNHMESEINTVKNNKKELQLYTDTILHLFRLLSKDCEKADRIAHIIKSDIQKELFDVNTELSAVCKTTGRKYIIDDDNINQSIVADKTAFEKMIKQILIYSEKISPNDLPIVFNVTSEENYDCVISCTFAIDSSMVNKIRDTFEFLRFSDIALPQELFENTETFCLALLYAAVNEIIVTYELIENQLFCFKIIPV